MSIVVGLGYGDEGKGLTTSFLVSQKNRPLVVRFNGGHQAGHTVNHNGVSHVFSHFGSGTLQRAPTYWSEHCTVEPVAFMREYNILKEKGVTPVIYIHPLCPVTTWMDIEDNLEREDFNKHGTVGVGFGSTIERHETGFKLYAQDLFNEKILFYKLNLIAHYYRAKHVVSAPLIVALKEFQKIAILSDLNGVLDRGYKWDNLVYEGAQGIMLDKDFGFFPHVTRSNTTSRNATNLGGDGIYYVTRTYATRHGNGPLTNEGLKLELKNNYNETNVDGGRQGIFRVAPLCVDTLNYALCCDNYFSGGMKKNLMITCMDQHEIDVYELLKKLDTHFEKVFVSYGASWQDVKQWK